MSHDEKQSRNPKLKPRRCCGSHRSIVLCLCRPVLYCPLWLLRLKVVKLCGLINFVACCCGACFASLLPARSLSVSVSHSICAVLSLLLLLLLPNGNCMLLLLLILLLLLLFIRQVSPHRGCQLTLLLLQHVRGSFHFATYTQTHTYIPHATRFYLFEMTFIGFYVFIWNFIKND